VSTPPTDADRALAGRVVAVPEARQLDVLANLLERRGATVLRCPLVGIKDSADTDAVVAWIERRLTAPTDLIVFYTGEGIERLLGFARRAGLESAFVSALAQTPKLTRGPKPKRALRRLELNAEFEAAEPTTAGLVATAATIAAPNGRVAIQLYSATQDPELLDHFRQRGIEPDCIAPYVYASAAEDEQVATLITELEAGRIDAIAFTSKAQVQRLLALARERSLEPALRSGLARTRVAAVGPVVSAELKKAGVRLDAMPEDSYSMKPLVTSVCELLRGSALP
jgi:uroporphyrinogen-III synthase